MILSNIGIQEALDSGRLQIDPEPQPRAPEKGKDCPYNTTAVDLTLGDEIVILKPDESPITMDLGQGELLRFLSKNAERRKLNPDQPFRLGQNRFVQGRTHERVHLPLNDDGPCYAARVEGRSSFARCGLLVHFTAPTIHAGYEGTITLEMINLGPYPILLHPGIPICQLIVEVVEGRPLRSDSQFQGHRSPMG